MNRRKFGDVGENIAIRHLEGLGFKIVEKNFRCKMGEIDIIAKKDSEIYFIEVKMRSSLDYGDPLESITWAKQKQISKAVKFYMLRQKGEVSCHLSAMGILFSETGDHNINFIPDAFELC